MELSEFRFEQHGQPVYYSLKYPSTLIFSPKAVREPTVLYELQELEHIQSIFLRELNRIDAIGSDTILGAAVKKIKFYSKKI